MHNNRELSSSLSTLRSLVTGGQTGVDRAALDVARELNLRCAGWCPFGRAAEDGTIDARYTLLCETPSADPSQRTEWNVRDSDGTLLLYTGEPRDGTVWTEMCAARQGKPLLKMDFCAEPDVYAFDRWLRTYEIRVLNVAGPRESFMPGVVYSRSREVLRVLVGGTR